jgi:hypothetical protein
MDLETQPLSSDSVDSISLKRCLPPFEDSALLAVRAELFRFKAIAAVFVGFFILLAISMGVIVVGLARSSVSGTYLKVCI